MRAWFAAVLALGAGCATDPYARWETATPSLSRTQLAELQKLARSPPSLGIEVRQQGALVLWRGVNELAVTGTVTVPLHRVQSGQTTEPGGQFALPVVLAVVNGQEGVRLLLDSGSNQSLCGYTLARRLGLVPVAGLQPVGAHGFGGAIDQHPALTLSVRIGSLELRKLVTMIGPDVQVLRVKQFWGQAPLFLLSVSQLRGLSYLTLDPIRGAAVFGTGEAYRPDSSSRWVTQTPLQWQNQLPCVSLSVDGKGPFLCVVDTGGNYGLLVPRAHAAALGYWRPGKEKLTGSSGIGGAGLATTYQVRSVTVGGATLQGVNARTMLLGPEPAGGMFLLGNEVLRRYRITFDFRQQRFWLEIPSPPEAKARG